MELQRRLYLLYADLLEYPLPVLRWQVDRCTELLGEVNPIASERLVGFRSWFTQETLAHAEEIYTSTFDLQGICCPYVGHHLFGENYQRSWFMAKLNEAYHERGFSCGTELPDHISIVLRFLALGDEDEFSRVLLMEGLIPSLGKMIQSFSEDGNHPYAQVLRSLLVFFQNGDVNGSDELTASAAGGMRDD